MLKHNYYRRDFKIESRDPDSPEENVSKHKLEFHPWPLKLLPTVFTIFGLTTD